MAAGTIYADWQSRLAPPWLRRTNGNIIETGFGGEKDIQLDRANQALLAGIPGKGPSDSLALLGTERMLPRISGESDVNYAERLRTAWDSTSGWSRGGSHGGLLRALDRAGFPMGTAAGCHIIQRVRRYSYLTASGGTVTYGTHNLMTFDNQPATVWNQFAILFAADVAGLDVGTPLADTLNLIVRQWKPAKARFMGTVVMVTGPLWGWPPGTVWGQALLDWGDSDSRFIPA